MHRSIWVLVTWAALFGLAGEAFAQAPYQVVSDTNILLFEDLHEPPFASNYALRIFQDAAATDYTGKGLAFYDGRLGGAWSNVDEGSEWYLVSEGETFSAARLAAGDLTSLPSGFGGGGVDLSGASSVYLGGATSSWTVDDCCDRTIFGWVELGINGDELVPLRSAVAYGAGGIIVGSVHTVPEPSAALLLVLGLIGLTASRQGDDRGYRS